MIMGDVVYGWTGDAENSGLPYPVADQSSPNAARDIQKLAETIAIYGDSRPDEHGKDGELDAPVGTLYIFNGTQAELEAAPVLGARVWRKTPTGWMCVEGDTGWYGIGSGSVGFHAQRLVSNGSTMELTIKNSGNFVVGTGHNRVNIFQGPGYRTSRVAVPTMVDAVGGNNKASTTISVVHFFDAGSFTNGFDAVYWVAATGGGSSGGGNCSANTYPTCTAVGQWPTSAGTGSARALRVMEEFIDGDITREECVEQIQDEITEIQNEGESHPQWDQYEQLKTELEQLYSQTQTGDL